MRSWPVLAFLFIGIYSCSDKYLAFRDQYRFRSDNENPDYSNLDYWAAHPLKKDLSDSTPAPLSNETKDTAADVFFLHPTTFTGKRENKEIMNARIDDAYINAKTDYSTILYQASAFNGCARVFAPRYRQAHISAFFADDKKAEQAFETAYEDLKKAFLYYLQHYNNGRPIIIAAHSQGSKLGERLLKEFFDGKELQNQLVAAYIIGWPVPKDYFSSIKICTDSLQTGCICSWRTFRRGYLPSYVIAENGNAYVTNPLTWTEGEQYAPRSLNKGSVLKNFKKIYYHTADAQISNGVLWIRKPRFPGGFFYFIRNYHIADINLYYINIRQNAAARINAFMKKDTPQ